MSLSSTLPDAEAPEPASLVDTPDPSVQRPRHGHDREAPGRRWPFKGGGDEAETAPQARLGSRIAKNRPVWAVRLTEQLGRLPLLDDPRVGAAVLVAVALSAGLFWYRAGIGDVGAASAGTLPPPVAQSAQPTGSGAPASQATGAPTAGSPTAAGPGASSGSQARSGAKPLPEVVVHVAGAVRQPGLYHLPGGSRVADAITAAGGPAPRADLDRLNLAAKLVDGQRIPVSRVGEQPLAGPDPTTAATDAPTSSSASPTAENPLDLNAATPAQLETLPGVGPATAKAILDQRTKQGGFKSVRDLLRIPGIGDRRFATLKDLVRV